MNSIKQQLEHMLVECCSTIYTEPLTHVFERRFNFQATYTLEDQLRDQLREDHDTNS